MTLSLNDASESWRVLVKHVEGFIESWEQRNEPPVLLNHLPAAEEPLRRVVLTELIKVDLEYRAGRGGEPKRLEDYLQDNPELRVDGKLPCDLIYEEFHLRRAAGEEVAATEYFTRFPDSTEELRQLLPEESPELTTTLVPIARVDDQIQAGDRLDDFQLLLQLGRGAFATVYLARQESLQRLVALKISADQGSEPQTLAQFDHPNIVRVYDQRQLPQQRIRLLYMQYVAGGTMHSVIQRIRGLPPSEWNGKLIMETIAEEASRGGHAASAVHSPLYHAEWPEAVCRLGVQLASALSYAHSKGVLHRDIKPGNVLLDIDGTPKLADFNISSSSKIDGAAPAAYFGGSLAYMSPEQLEACNPAHRRQPRDLDGRSDIYSCGIVLWELLNGNRPFQDEHLEAGWTATLEHMTERRIEGLQEHQPPEKLESAASELQRTLLKCLAARREDRFSSADELAHELLLCLQPRTQRLLKLPTHGWRDVARRWPLAAITFVTLIPNVLAGIFNFWHTHYAIRQHTMDMLPTFETLQVVISSIAYPLGGLLGLFVTWPAVRPLIKMDHPPPSPEQATWIRQRTLALGGFAALICAAEWIVAGVAYPICLNVILGELDPAWYFHFGSSLALSGLIAAAYPFFLVTFLCVRVYYPAHLSRVRAGAEDFRSLQRLQRNAGIYLYMAVGVPALAILVQLITSAADARNTPALIGLSALGFLGSLFALLLYRIIQSDTEALLRAVNPNDPFDFSAESFSSRTTNT